MNKEELIDAIMKIQPKELNGTNGIPATGTIVYDPLVKKFGYLYLGVGELWEWFDNRKLFNGAPRFTPQDGDCLFHSGCNNRRTK